MGLLCAGTWLTWPVLSQNPPQRTPPARQPEKPPAEPREAPPTDAPPASSTEADDPNVERQWWREADVEEKAVIGEMLRSDDWAFRALALMRLDRFRGPEVDAMLADALDDPTWQVRCFAIRHAWKHGVAIDGSRYAKEDDPRVLRTALAFGVEAPAKVVEQTGSRLLRTRSVDALIVGIELGAACRSDEVRREATQRALTLVRNMDPVVAGVIGRRLARVFQIDPAPPDALAWRRWVAGAPKNYVLPPLAAPGQRTDKSLVSMVDADTFVRLRDYMGVLRRRNLEMVIAVDATNSMTPVIDEVKADVDALILFLTDISSTLKLGMVAYRDHDNPGKLIEGHPFTTNVDSLRHFLFGLQTPGGPTFPEAVLAGVQACGPRQFPWSERAEREIILIGDAPPHDHESSELRATLEWYRQNGLTVHAVHVPMQWPAGYLRSLPRAQAEQQEAWRQDYNIATRRAFSDIASIGGGQLVEFDASRQTHLVRSIMKLTLEPEWWPYFDDFYDGYLDLCR